MNNFYSQHQRSIFICFFSKQFVFTCVSFSVCVLYLSSKSSIFLYKFFFYIIPFNFIYVFHKPNPFFETNPPMAHFFHTAISLFGLLFFRIHTSGFFSILNYSSKSYRWLFYSCYFIDVFSHTLFLLLHVFQILVYLYIYLNTLYITVSIYLWFFFDWIFFQLFFSSLEKCMKGSHICVSCIDRVKYLSSPSFFLFHFSS